MKNKKKIAVLAGDGIGPEIIGSALQVLETISSSSYMFEINEYPVGGYAIDRLGNALPAETLRGCEDSQAILFGSIGGPQWEHLPPNQQPERAALLPLRKHFHLFANLRPIEVYSQLGINLPVNNSAGARILIIRELTGGIYFGHPKKKEGNGANQFALDTMLYHRYEIERIAHLAFQMAKQRKSVIHSIDKANVLTSMSFWREVVRELHQKEYADITLKELYVDNAAMQLILNPKQFDIMLCPNLFGDILSDEASGLSGSLGLLPSASLGESRQSVGRFGLYEPAGGSAPDIAGHGIANPIAQILSLALMLRYSFSAEEPARLIENAVTKAISAGARTQDLISNGEKAISCAEMTTEICRQIQLSRKP